MKKFMWSFIGGGIPAVIAGTVTHHWFVSITTVVVANIAGYIQGIQGQHE